MSHELRTPFRLVLHSIFIIQGLTDSADSSFYGLLDILSGTDLNMGQREIGKSPSGEEGSSSNDQYSHDCQAILRATPQGMCYELRVHLFTHTLI